MDAIDLEMHAGESKTFSLTVLDDDDNPVDLTDAEITWVLMKHPGNVALVPKITPDHITTRVPNSGPGSDPPVECVFDVPFDPEDTAALEPRGYYYEAEVIEADGTSSTVLDGRFTLHASSILPA